MIISAATDKLMIRATRNSIEKKPNGMWDDYGVPNDTDQQFVSWYIILTSLSDSITGHGICWDKEALSCLWESVAPFFLKHGGHYHHYKLQAYQTRLCLHSQSLQNFKMKWTLKIENHC